MPRRPSVFIVDDDQSLCEILANLLKYEGYRTDMAHDGKTALTKLRQISYDLMLLDLKLPDTTGMSVLEKALKIIPTLQTIMISGQGTIDLAVEATRKGAYDFLEKPLDSERILVTLKNAFDRGQLVKDRARLLESVKSRYVMIGESKPMQQVADLIQKAAATHSKVLIEGENGTGKELAARAIYFNSARAGEPFIPVNCAAIPETLIESELFGHKKGAFTGATDEKIGRFQQADGGMLFLDEIGDMSLMTQAKVLRSLEEGTVEMVGGGKPIPIDVRIIAATNKNLQEEMRAGHFREDLYFRLNVLNIKLPPLRERKEDIPQLVNHFIQCFCNEHGVAAKHITPGAMSRLMEYSWPGNIRELKNFIEKLIFLVEQSKIESEDVSSTLNTYSTARSEPPKTLKEARQQFEREFISERLLACQGNVTKTAELLGIPRTYLYKKMKNLKVEV